MIKRKILIASLLSLGIVIFIANAENTFSQEASMIKIWSKKEGMSRGIHADPLVLTVKKNTIVVWLNGVKDEEIQISFEEGKTCRDVTADSNLKNPGFFMDSKGCYVASFLPYGSTSMLQFPETGEFDYRVLTKDDTMSTNGRIVVKP